MIKIILLVIIQFFIFHTKLALKPCKCVLENQLNPCFQKFQCFNLGFISGFKIGFIMKKMVLIWFSQQLELVFQPSKKLATLPMFTKINALSQCYTNLNLIRILFF